MAESKARNINKSFNPSGTIDTASVTHRPTDNNPDPIPVLAALPETGALDSADVATIAQENADGDGLGFAIALG